MFLPSRQRRLNSPEAPDRVEVQPSLTRRGNIRQPSRGLKPTAKFKAPRCGGGICEVKAGKQTSHIFQALKTKLDLAITFQKQNRLSRIRVPTLVGGVRLLSPAD